MSCLTSGLSINCADFCSGGLDKFYLATIDDVASVTITLGEVTAITMQATKLFYEFKPYQETATFTETVTRTNCNTQVEDVLTAIFPCHSQATREAVAEMQACCCGLVVIHQEANGNRWIWGLTKDLESSLTIGFPAQLTNVETITGAALSDQNQTTITLQAKATFQAYPLDAAVVVPIV